MVSHNRLVPRKPALSPSRITTFLACPVKYRWTYQDPRGRLFVKSKSYYSFGLSLHRAIERFHESQAAGVATVGEAMASLESGWIESGYASPEEAADALGEGKEILSRYIHDQEADAAAGITTVFVEKTLSMAFEDFNLSGRIDRLSRHPDSTLDVIDYKTGGRRVTPELVRDDVAMSCYQLLVRQSFPGVPVRATIMSIASGHRASYALTDAEAAEFLRDLTALGQDIVSTDYAELTPVPKAMCHSCDFLPLCRRHPDFELEPLSDDPS